MDQEKNEGGSAELEAIERMQTRLTAAIEGVRTESRDMALKAVEDFAGKLEGQLSRKAPVPPKETESRSAEPRRVGDYYEARDMRVLGDARDPLYRRLEDGLKSYEIEDLRASRNPRMDDLTAAWCQAVHTRNVGERVRLYDEMNGRYAESLGYSRAALLAGLPDATSGFGAGTGGELMPLPLAGQLIIARDRASAMRKLVNVFPMSTQTQRIPVLPTVAANTRLENAAYTDNTPAAGSALLSAKDLGVMFSAGRDFLEDSAFQMATQLTMVAGAAIGAEEDEQICNSNGTAPNFTGSLDSETVTDVPEIVATAIAYRDIATLYYALPQQYRRNAKFFAAGTTIVDLMILLDGLGRPIFMSHQDAPRPISDTDPDAIGIFYGKPIYEVPIADDVIMFGDPQWYGLGTRAGIRVEHDTTISTGLHTWVIDERIDGRMVPTAAVGTNNAWRKVVY